MSSMVAGAMSPGLRPGQDQQLGALGLARDMLTLWNSGYMDHVVELLRSEGTTIADEDLEHLSPLRRGRPGDVLGRAADD